MVFLYMMHGVIVSLPFACADLGEPVHGLNADLTVVAGPVPRSLDAATLHQTTIDVSPAALLFRGGQHSARFLVENGTSITFDKNPGCEEPLFLHHLLYPVMVGALWQRGLCVLHASSVLSPRGAVLVTGQSGAGKSTTVARLMADGWPLLTDEVSAIGPGATGVLDVWPGPSAIQLDEQSCTHLGFDTRGLDRREWQRAKMSVRTPPSGSRQGATVAQIVYLQHADAFSVRTVRGRDKFELLLRAIYGPVLADVVAGLEGVLGRAIREIEMIAIGRPPGRWSLDDIVGAIRNG